MKGLACIRAARLHSRGATRLSEAERLTLEEHLQDCRRCRRDAAALSALVALSDAIDTGDTGSRSELHRERAIAAALRADPGIEVVRPARAWRAALVGGLIAISGLLAWRETRDEGQGRARGVAEVRGVDAGAPPPIRAPGTPVRQAAPPGREYLAQVRERMVAGPLLLEVAPGTRLVRDGAHAPWMLIEGRAVVDATSPGELRTQRFRVRIASARVMVEPDRVSVVHGEVHVLAADGQALASLGAGEQWASAPVAARPGRSGAAGRTGAGGDELDAAETDDSGAGEGETSGAPAPKPRRESIRPRRSPARSAAAAAPDVESLVADARRLLADGRLDAARARLDAAQATTPGTMLRAEIETLRAELSLVSGDRAGAATRYEDVATRFAGMPAGENALFAAARLHARLGRIDRAHRLWQRYVEEYPRGRFRAEVERRLSGAGR